MKDRAKILNWKGKELKTPRDIIVAETVIMLDLVEGNITPSEARTIQRDINERIKAVDGAIKTLRLVTRIDKLEKGGRKI